VVIPYPCDDSVGKRYAVAEIAERLKATIAQGINAMLIQRLGIAQW